MKQLVITLGLACVLGGSSLHAADLPSKAASKEKWVQLFNGKDLKGWTPKIRGYKFGENFANTFRVEDGAIKVSYDGYETFDGKFGHLFFKKSYSKYRLRIEYRFRGDQAKGGPGWAFRNSGVMIHCQTPQSMTKDQEFPASIEVQFLGGKESGERSTGNLCTPGTNVVMDGVLVTQHCTNSNSKTYRGDQWVTAEVEVHGGGQVKHIINGETVLTYTEPQLDESNAAAQALIKDGRKIIQGGYISLQAESHPIEFRKVEILELKE